MALTNFSRGEKPRGERITGADIMGKTVEMVMDRDFLVRSTLGHMVRFHKGKPLPVPSVMVRTCAEFGARRVDGEEAIAPEPEEDKPTQSTDPRQRLDDVRMAIDRIVERNDVDDFTAGGSPKVSAVSKETGYKIDRTEVSNAWKIRNEELANEG